MEKFGRKLLKTLSSSEAPDMKKQLPQKVKSLGLALKSDKDHELSELAGKLITDSQEHIDMWLAIEKREEFLDDDLWIWIYLKSIYQLSALPPYYYISANERCHLSDQITNLTLQLEKLYLDNGLDFRLVAANGKMFNGFYVLDDFSDKNKEGFESDEQTQKCDFIPILKVAAQRAGEKIKEADHRGKAGKNVRAIRLIRELSEKHIKRYGTPLNSVLATVANTFFGTNFIEADISKIISRVGNQ